MMHNFLALSATFALFALLMKQADYKWLLPLFSPG